MRIVASLVLLSALAGCAVVEVVGATARVVATGVELTGSVVGATIDVAGSAVGGAIDLATSGGDDGSPETESDRRTVPQGDPLNPVGQRPATPPQSATEAPAAP
jgi:hypothetical protein